MSMNQIKYCTLKTQPISHSISHAEREYGNFAFINLPFLDVLRECIKKDVEENGEDGLADATDQGQRLRVVLLVLEDAEK
jgi:hypothetical protein